MSNPLTMFHEKAKEANPWSMTRVVAFMFAVTYCVTLYVYGTKAFAINWPFAVLGVCTLGAVPLQGMLTYLQNWIASAPGRALTAKLLEKVIPGAGSTVASTVLSSITTTPADK